MVTQPLLGMAEDMLALLDALLRAMAVAGWGPSSLSGSLCHPSQAHTLAEQIRKFGSLFADASPLGAVSPC